MPNEDWAHPNARYYERLVMAYLEICDSQDVNPDFVLFKKIYDRSSLDRTSLILQKEKEERQANGK